MIDLDSAMRSERALIGLLLADNQLLDEVPNLRPDDFGQPDLRSVFDAIIDVRAEYPDAYGAQLFALVTDRTRLPGIDSAHLHGLALNRPEPANVAVYAQLAQEAGLRRSLASHADRIGGLAGEHRGSDPGLNHLSRLSLALNRSALRTDSSGDLENVAEALGRTLNAGTALGSVYVDREDLILADLLQNPDMLPEVQGWLSAEYFTSGRHREVYEAMIAVARNGEQVNKRTLAVELDRGPASVEVAAAIDPRADADAPGTAAEPIPVFLARLMTTDVFEGMSLVAGRDLLDHNIRMELAAMRAPAEAGGSEPDAAPRRLMPPSRETTHRAQVRGPELLQPPPTPGLGPDGPQVRM